jgi:CRISPR system Cascade subunit CasA
LNASRTNNPLPEIAVTLRYNLLDEPLIRTRLVADGQPRSFSLPGLFVALGQDAVRDFPALRPHQRHPWHAFLVQLAAIALHRAGRSELFDSEAAWKQALLDLTPEHPDGAAWCLIAPHDRPAFMQAPVPGGRIDSWKNTFRAADELDMLVTSKNHDLKAARMRYAEAGRLDNGLDQPANAGRLSGCGKLRHLAHEWWVCQPPGDRCGAQRTLGPALGQRCQRSPDHREAIIDQQGLKDVGGICLVWLQPWDGEASLPFGALDPWYIEICRRIRFVFGAEVPAAYASRPEARFPGLTPKAATG